MTSGLSTLTVTQCCTEKGLLFVSKSYEESLLLTVVELAANKAQLSVNIPLRSKIAAERGVSS